MAGIRKLKADLERVEKRIEEAEQAASLGVEGRSLTRQSLDQLEKKAASLRWDIASYYRGSSLGRVEFVYDDHYFRH